MILANYDHQTGKSCRTIAIRNLMARNGFDWKEDFVFGLGGGFNFSFVMPDKEVESRFFKALSPNLFQFENFAENLGVEYQVITKAEDGFELMEDILRYDDNPVLCEVSPEEYKKETQKEGTHFWDGIKLEGPITSHITEVIGIDEEKVYFCENYSKDVMSVSREIFAKARDTGKDSYLNPHHKIHYYVIPDEFEDGSMEMGVKKSISRNMRAYCDNPNERLGKKAFDSFMENLPNCYDLYGDRLCGTSLKITGSLIKYVSPGMFRKIYARFLEEATKYIGYEDDLKSIASLLKKSDFTWNKLASLFLDEEISVKDRMIGKKCMDFMKTIKDTEEEAVLRMCEVSEAW
ncbi:BtrH N-terminal domain-containing protein [Butyrivibrio sp. YAB3001]|uniref:BtrH N-terminal domain-containing protein n=1 Tax=Butyrivibrio sp. YAB3001 TaxID=1520812 RepID=UPI0008F63532|nr:BtrH N-terminal domain-containing protein [Butyrivibrio sp. YAB3001]SFC12977.1 protein of unknown function [Butyrivibrio sp. YAB3001]